MVDEMVPIALGCAALFCLFGVAAGDAREFFLPFPMWLFGMLAFVAIPSSFGRDMHYLQQTALLLGGCAAGYGIGFLIGARWRRRRQ